MKTPIPRAPKSAILFINNGDGTTSPIVRLADNPEAEAWLVELEAVYAREQEHGSHKYQPSESPLLTAFVSFEVLLKALKKRENVVIWDLCNKVYGEKQSNGAFEETCAKLLPQTIVPVKADGNVEIWLKVFAEIKTERPDLELDEETLLAHSGADNTMYPEVHVIGVFLLPNRSLLATTFMIDASRDSRSGLKFEIAERTEGLTYLSEKERTHVDSLLAA